MRSTPSNASTIRTASTSNMATVHPQRPRRRRLTTCSSSSILQRLQTYDQLLARQLGRRPSEFVRREPRSGRRSRRRFSPGARTTTVHYGPFLPYVEPLLPGRWQPTPPKQLRLRIHSSPGCRADGAGLTDAVPAVPPPSLISAQYATDLNEVKAIGKSDSASRTSEQTESLDCGRGSPRRARRRDRTPMFAVWNNITRDAIRQRGTVAGRCGAAVHAGQRLDPRCSPHHADEQIRVRVVASGHGHSQGRRRSQTRNRSGFGLAVADYHAAVSVSTRATCLRSAGQLDTCPRRVRRDQRHARCRDLASVRMAPPSLVTSMASGRPPTKGG